MPRFAKPKPLSIAEVQALLNADEALLLFLDVKQLGRSAGADAGLGTDPQNGDLAPDPDGHACAG